MPAPLHLHPADFNDTSSRATRTIASRCQADHEREPPRPRSPHRQQRHHHHPRHDTLTFSLTQATTAVTEGNADSYTVHLSNPLDPGVTVSVTSPSPCRAGSAAPRRRISPMPSWPTSRRGGATTGVTPARQHADLRLNLRRQRRLQLHPADLNDTWSRATRTTAWRCQRRPRTRAAPGRDRSHRHQRHHHHPRQRHATFSLTQASTDRQRGQRRQLHGPSLQPDRSRRHRQRHLAITLPGGLGGAEAADFTHAFLADIQTAVAATTGVTRSRQHADLRLHLRRQRRLQLHPADLNDTLVEGDESYSVALSAPATNASGASVVIVPRRQRHHHHPRQRHATFSLTQGGADRQRGQRRQLHGPSLQPDRSRRHRQRQHRHHPAGRARRRRGGGFHQCLPGRHSDGGRRDHGRHPLGNTLTFDSTFDASAGFSFTLPTSTTPWSRATRTTAWRCQRRPPTRPAPRS